MKSYIYFSLIFLQLQFLDYQQTRFRVRTGCQISSFHSPSPPSSDQRNAAAPPSTRKALRLAAQSATTTSNGSVAAQRCDVAAAPPGSATQQRRILPKERRRRSATESTAVAFVVSQHRNVVVASSTVERTRLVLRRRLVLAVAAGIAMAQWSLPTADGCGRGRHGWIAAHGKAGARRSTSTCAYHWGGSLFRQSQRWRHSGASPLMLL